MHHIPKDKKTKYGEKDICKNEYVLKKPNKTKQYEMMWVKGSRWAFWITEGVFWLDAAVGIKKDVQC